MSFSPEFGTSAASILVLLILQPYSVAEILDIGFYVCDQITYGLMGRIPNIANAFGRLLLLSSYSDYSSMSKD